MKLVFSTNGALIGQVLGHYRHPLLFRKAEKAASLVVMEQEYPEIRAAYEARGVRVVLLAEAGDLGETVPLADYLSLQKRAADLEAALAVCQNESPPLEKLTVKQLQEKLTALGVPFKQSAGKAELLALLQGAMPPESGYSPEPPPYSPDPPASGSEGASPPTELDE